MIINLGRMLPHASSDLPETTRAALWSLFSLASDGVYTAISVTRDAVVSYTAFSPLPFRAVIFCCTFPGVASAGRYPASCPVKPGLSSIFHAIIRPTHVYLIKFCNSCDLLYTFFIPKIIFPIKCFIFPFFENTIGFNSIIIYMNNVTNPDKLRNKF